MKIEATEVFDFLYSNWLQYKDKYDKLVFVLEGSSGSSKTYSIIQFLFLYAQASRGKKITCGRSKMTWAITSIWSDFKDQAEALELGYSFNVSKYTAQAGSNRFRFVGADDPQKFHGPRQDVSWFNEAMELAEKSYNQVSMRTNELFILDFNPSAEKHWIFDRLLGKGHAKHGQGTMRVMSSKDEDGKDITEAVFYLHSTFRCNAFLPAGQRKVILGYEPTPENIEAGTADQWHWDVYGLGKRATAKGAVYPYWKTGFLPPHLRESKPLVLWLDFGFVNSPTAIGKMWYDKGVIYVKSLCYETGLTNTVNADNPQQDSIEAVLRRNGITSETIVADGAEQKSIKELRLKNFSVVPMVNKGEVAEEITRVKKYKVVIVGSPDIEEEKRMYRWVENPQDGSLTNTPIKKYDHHMDGIRYAVKYLETKFII